MRLKTLLTYGLCGLSSILLGCNEPGRYQDLRELRPGIYAQSGELPTTGKITIAVHPYFISREENKSYYSGLETFVKGSDDLLIVLEEADRVNSTVTKINDLKDEPSIFVPTGRANPWPRETSWANFVNFLKGYSSREPFDLVGGYNHGYGKGCLGATQAELTNEGLRVNVIPSLTFQSEFF